MLQEVLSTPAASEGLWRSSYR